MIVLCEKTLDEIALLLSSKIDFSNIRSASFNLTEKHLISVDNIFSKEIFVLECLISTSSSGLINEAITIPRTDIITNYDDFLYPLDKIFSNKMISLNSTMFLKIKHEHMKGSFFTKIDRYMYSENMRADFVNIDAIRSIEDDGKKVSIILNDIKCCVGSSYVNTIGLSKDYLIGLYKIFETCGRYDLLI